MCIRDSSNSILYRLDADTALATRIGETEDYGNVNINNPIGMTSIGSRLLMVTTDLSGSRANALYEFDLKTGEASQVGNAHNFGVNSPTIEPDTLFYIP